MNISIIILMLIILSYWFPMMLTSKPKMVVIFSLKESNFFQTCVFLVFILGATPNHISHHSNVGILIKEK